MERKQVSNRYVTVVLTICLLAIAPCTSSQVSGQTTDQIRQEVSAAYFPNASGHWETVNSADTGADEKLLQQALDFAGSKKSNGVVVLWRGRIVSEQYWNGWDKDSSGPLYSSTKSLVSTLVGIAIADGKIKKVSQPVADFISEWQDKAGYKDITVEHLLSMTGGLEGGARNFALGLAARDERAFATSLPIVDPPGTRWDYHNSAYHLLFSVLQEATGRPLDDYSREKLFEPLGMEHASWFKKRRGNEQYAHMIMSTRDAARFGLLIQRKGNWNGNQIISEDWVKEATSPWNKKVNPSYGYLWWLNSGETYYLPMVPAQRRGPLLKDCPADTIAALGKDDQKIYVVPSLELVVVRLGDAADRSSPALSNFDSQFLGKICAAFKR